MLGKVLQVNVSRGGIPKRPVRVAKLTRLGVEGDSHAHPAIHGGPRKAVLLLCQEAIDELRALGFPVYPGALGENLTIQGIDRRMVRPGQRYQAGDAIVEITRPREPCNTLHVYGTSIQKAAFDEQVKAGDPKSPKWGLAGFYASVVREGILRPGAPIELLEELA